MSAAKRSPVPSLVGGYLGDLVTWKFRAFKVRRSEVRSIFERHGFEACLDWDLSDPTRALAQGHRSGVKFGDSHVARTMPKPNKDTRAAVGVYERFPTIGEGGDGWECGARVRIVNDRAVALAPEGKVELPACMRIADEIASRTNELMQFVENVELSTAVVDAGRHCWWAPFRQAGGVYWVPQATASRMRVLLDSLEAVSAGEFLPTIQPLIGDPDGRTARNVGRVAQEAIDAELAELTSDLQLAADGKLGKRGAESRIERAREVLIRAGQYKEALQGDADALESTVNAIIRRFGALVEVKKDEFDGALSALESRVV